MGLFNKKELRRISELNLEVENLKAELKKTGSLELSEIKKLINNEKLNLADIQSKTFKAKTQLKQLQNTVIDLEDSASMQEFGFYKPKYDCMSSEEYAQKISKVRSEQKEKVKQKIALSYYDGWTLDGNKSKGKAMNNDNMKMVLRAFNNECDVFISKAKFNNIDKIEDKIRKSAIQIDKLNVRNKISILKSYIDLKIKELHLVHEHAVKKQEEKELLREQRAHEREEAKLQKEIENARKDVIKEQSHYNNALSKLNEQIANCTDEAEKQQLTDRLTEINTKLSEINKQLDEIDYRETNKRAGYVYIISNIGAFGEDIYKIGMTRRLEPLDRVDELGDASVPFSFDVHAMIFSDDAPKLENALHKAFDANKLNMINGRKEFFKVKLEDIEEVVKNNHDKLVVFNKIPDAIQYRETLLLKNNS